MKKVLYPLIFIQLLVCSSCNTLFNDADTYSAIQHQLLWERLADCEGEIGKEKGEASVETAVFSEDDRYVASVSHEGGDIIVWDSESGESKLERSTNYPLKSISFSPYQNHILVGGQNRFLKIMDIHTGEIIHKLDAMDAVECIAFSNDKKLLAVGNNSGMILVWETSGYEIIKELTHDKAEEKHDVNSLCFTANDKYLISGGYNAKIIVWDVKDNFSEFKLIDKKYGSIKSVRVSPNEKYIASSSSERMQEGKSGNSLCIWDMKTGKNLFTSHFDFGMEAVAFSPNGQFLLAGGTEGKDIDGPFSGFGNIYVYKINNDKTKPLLEITNKIKTFRSEYLEFNSTGDRLLSAHEDGSIKMWSIEYITN